ncbi:cilia- and flagella-associated protein 77 isoform X2 [Paralichthys olivaceus]|uniref:cilia- and flagella-associated protein 77 isoform X2 n=1 Tax=Paralichthys olivaceus TaxID=8255 RepID=UPI0037530106
MSSPRMGVVRDSMLTNPLMIKASLGQSRSRCFSLSGPDFTFGTSSSSRQNGGVAEVLSSWRVQPRREELAPHRVVVPDFVSLNRNAVKAGLVSSSELRQYRAQVGGGKTKHPTSKQQEGGASQQLVVPDITTRPSSPLSDLLSHQYARRWKDEQLSRIQTSNHHQQLRMKPGSDTRTSLLRRSRPLPATRPLFRLQHFTQVNWVKSEALMAAETLRDQVWKQRGLKDLGHFLGVAPGFGPTRFSLSGRTARFSSGRTLRSSARAAAAAARRLLPRRESVFPG